MSLLLSDGCTKTSTPTQIYPTASASVLYTSAKGAFGTPALDIPANVSLPVILPASIATGGINFWFQFATNPGTFTLVSFQDTVAGNVQVSFQITGGGQMQLLRGATILATAGIFVVNTQYHLEIIPVIDPSTGSVQVRLNGNTSALINFSGNTRNTANSSFNEIIFGPAPNAGGAHIYVSHVVLYDTAGAAPNGFIGMKRIYTCVPTTDSASGGLNQFSTSPSQSAGNHWQNVDEEPPDEDTSYNFDNTVGHRESYKVNGLPSSVVTITVVNAFARVRIDDAGPHSVNIVARSNSVDSVGGAQFEGPQYGYINQPFPVDPNTSSAWTPSGFGTGTNSTAEFGIEIAS